MEQQDVYKIVNEIARQHRIDRSVQILDQFNKNFSGIHMRAFQGFDSAKKAREKKDPEYLNHCVETDILAMLNWCDIVAILWEKGMIDTELLKEIDFDKVLIGFRDRLEAEGMEYPYVAQQWKNGAWEAFKNFQRACAVE